MIVRRPIAAWLLFLFGLPFLGIGVHTLAVAGRCWYTYASARSWQRVPATIRRVESEYYTSGDASCHRVAADYSYDVNDRNYSASRVSIMADGQDAWTCDELCQYRDDSKPFPAYVNPRDPSQSLLYRDADARMYDFALFGLLFAGVGLVISGAGVGMLRQARQLRGIAAEDGERYWHVRADWRRGRVTASTIRNLLLRWALGVGLALFAACFVIPFGGPSGVVMVGFVGLSLAAMIFLVAALLATVRQVLYGTPVLHLSEVPIVPGRRVSAVVRTAGPLRARRWTAWLRCYVVEDGLDPKSRHADVRQLHDRLVQRLGPECSMPRTVKGGRAYNAEAPCADASGADDPGDASLTVVIEVPADAPDTNLSPNPSVQWVLDVRAKAVPLSLVASFDLPVFYAEEQEIEARPLGG